MPFDAAVIARLMASVSSARPSPLAPKGGCVTSIGGPSGGSGYCWPRAAIPSKSDTLKAAHALRIIFSSAKTGGFVGQISRF